jgi:putative glycosyltransferase (TIGR04372 family)
VLSARDAPGNPGRFPIGRTMCSVESRNQVRRGGRQGFCSRKWEQTLAGGWPLIRLKVQLTLRRLRSLILVLVALPAFLVPVLVMRLMRPWLQIRLGKFESEGIGHFALPVEVYLSEVDSGFHAPSGKFLDIWYVGKVVCNRVLLEKWARIFKIWPREIVKPIDDLNRFLPGGEAHRIPYRTILERDTPWQFCDIHETLDRTPPHLQFTADEDAEGVAALDRMGIDRNSPIVCFVIRDPAYYNETHLRWDHRNTSVSLLLPAMRDLAESGYTVIRMGARVNEPLQTANPAIVDYATNGMRTELLDLLLISGCKFMVSTGTGLDSVAPTFRRPLVITDFAQFGDMDLHGKSAMFVPKHFWSIREKRMLTFVEIFELGAHLFTLSMQYVSAGVESVDNTPDEICAVVDEMERRLSGTWVSDPEEEILQNRFRTMWPQRTKGRPLQARIGTEFLRQHPELL